MRALSILQASFDKLAANEIINYRITKADTMIKESRLLSVEHNSVEGIIKKNAYWHLCFENKYEWLIQHDTLYKKEAINAHSIKAITDWNNHDLACFSVYNILGAERPTLRTAIAMPKFVQDTTDAKT